MNKDKLEEARKNLTDHQKEDMDFIAQASDWMFEPDDDEQNEELKKISDAFQKIKNQFEKKNDDWWGSLSLEEKEHAFYAVVKRIHQGEMIDKGSYRYILYDVFGFDVGMYVQGMNCGFMDIHNAILVDLNDGDDTNETQDI